MAASIVAVLTPLTPYARPSPPVAASLHCDMLPSDTRHDPIDTGQVGPETVLARCWSTRTSPRLVRRPPSRVPAWPPPYGRNPLGQPDTTLPVRPTYLERLWWGRRCRRERAGP